MRSLGCVRSWQPSRSNAGPPSRPVDLAPLSGRPADVVTRWVRRGIERRQRDAELREAYDRLDDHLGTHLGGTLLHPTHSES